MEEDTLIIVIIAGGIGFICIIAVIIAVVRFLLVRRTRNRINEGIEAEHDTQEIIVRKQETNQPLLRRDSVSTYDTFSQHSKSPPFTTLDEIEDEDRKSSTTTKSDVRNQTKKKQEETKVPAPVQLDDHDDEEVPKSSSLVALQIDADDLRKKVQQSDHEKISKNQQNLKEEKVDLPKQQDSRDLIIEEIRSDDLLGPETVTEAPADLKSLLFESLENPSNEPMQPTISSDFDDLKSLLDVNQPSHQTTSSDLDDLKSLLTPRSPSTNEREEVTDESAASDADDLKVTIDFGSRSGTDSESESESQEPSHSQTSEDAASDEETAPPAYAVKVSKKNAPSIVIESPPSSVSSTGSENLKQKKGAPVMTDDWLHATDDELMKMMESQFGKKKKMNTARLSRVEPELTVAPGYTEPAKKAKGVRPSMPWAMDVSSIKDEQMNSKMERISLNRRWVPGTDPIVRDFAVLEETNKRGLKRAKKSKIQMEDSSFAEFPLFQDENIALFCVFDGHGGRECADTLKELFAKEFYDRFKLKEDKTDLTDIFQTTYREVDSKMKNYEYVGATATTVCVWRYQDKRYLQAANVGDSTSFLQRMGSLMLLTKEHKPNKSWERERILASGIQLTQHQTRLGGLSVSRAMGDHFMKNENTGMTSEPSVSESVELLPTDTLLIVASDGLWDVMSGEHAMEVAHAKSKAEEMTKTLIDSALNNPKCLDNVTIIVAIL